MEFYILNGVMNVLILQLCVFFFIFVSVPSRFGVVIEVLIFDFSPSLERKIHLVDTLGGSKVKNVQYFSKRHEKP
jgi:hypothetical protein